MNYGKLQLSFILLLIMTLILSLTCFFVVKNLLLTITSVIAMLLCILGLVYCIKKEEHTHQNDQKNNLPH